MDKAQNIYSRKPPKSGNDEMSYFLTKGRIRRRAFFLRLLLLIGLLVISNMIMYFYAIPKYEYLENFGHGEVRSQTFLITYQLFFTFNYMILPVLCSFFFLIQGAKRMHDVNKSGWYFFVPVYNILLSFIPGTIGQNSYGIDTKPTKAVKYFDELEKKK